MKITFLAICFTLALQLSAASQTLLPPLEEMPMSNHAYLLLKNGEVIEGNILYTHSGRGLTKVALKDANGEKHVYKAVDIEEFAIVSNKWVKLQYHNESGASIKRLLTTNHSNIQDQDFVIFRNTKLKKGKPVLLQLLNPHFDERFEVFYDPFARKSTPLTINSVTLTGEMHRAFYVSKDGGPIMKVKKESYKKIFGILFGDCLDLLKTPEVKFRDLGQHIWNYSENCSLSN